MKEQKRRIKGLFLIAMICISILSAGKSVQAATEGTIPCSDGGSIVWTLDDEGVLTISGSGTMKSGSTWSTVWSGLTKTAVTAVDIEDGSDIKLKTCLNMFLDFTKCKTIDLEGLDTSNVTNMQSMFDGCEQLTTLDVTGLDTGKATNMYRMFWNCSNLTVLDVSGFDTQNVKNMCGMFSGCSKVEVLDVSGFDTSKVVNMDAMFQICYAVTELDVSGFDTSNVVSDMGWMFYGCSSLTTLDLSGFDTSKVTSMQRMFCRCTNLKELNLSGFDTSSVTIMQAMFYGCENLTELDLSHFNTENVTNISDMFCDCTALEKLDISGFIVGSKTSLSKLLQNDMALEYLVTPKMITGLELPMPAGKVWVDDAKNVYEENTVSFTNATILHCVNETYKIDYISKGTLVDCSTEYSVKTGLSQLGTADFSPCSFGGWYTNENYDTEVTDIEKGTYGDITLYGKVVHNNFVTKNQKEATCTAEGYTGDKHCKDCDALVEKGVAIPMVAHDIDREHGTVVKAATELETGIMEYKCKNCTYTITEEIPKLETSSDGELKDDEVLDSKNDKDVKGSSFVLLQAKADKTTKNSIRLKWTKVKGADGYMIYGNKCGWKESQHRCF